MRRASAISLLAAISFSQIAPLALAGPDAQLPACCRRNGAHHCDLAGDAATAKAPSGPAVRAIWKCPRYPASTAMQPRGAAAPLENPPAIFGELVSHPALPIQTGARMRIAFTRSRQKRGPPVLS